MFKKLIRTFQSLQGSSSKNHLSGKTPSVDLKVFNEIENNLEFIKNNFNYSSDIVIREFTISSKPSARAAVLFINGLVDEDRLSSNVLNPLLSFKGESNIDNLLHNLKESVISVSSLKESIKISEAVDALIDGNTVIFVDGVSKAIIVSVQGYNTRGVEEPQTEVVVRGPREGFVEDISINMTLIRRKIRNPNLVFEEMRIGEQTNTKICIAYIRGIAKDNIVQELKTRLSRINIDSILESGYIESFIQDSPYSLFPTVGYSEKPDNVSSKILEGRIAILIDGTPFVLTVPFLFVEVFQSSEDYYISAYYATFIRSLRWLGFFITTFLPGLYVAVTSFHQELLPPALLITIAASQEGTPFPIAIEVLIMVIVFEILREAGVRMPKAVGQAVSIVGALVIGDAAVSAGLVGTPMIVVIAATAISSFIVPFLMEVITLTRIIFIIAAGFAGLYGAMLVFAIFLTHQCSLRSFGVPYFSPLAPSILSDQKDVIIRVPWWLMKTRPRLFNQNTQKQSGSQKPSPPAKDVKGEKN